MSSRLPVRRTERSRRPGHLAFSSYYRTGAGAEVDLVIEGDFGRVAIEIKHTSFVDPRALRGLRDFVAEHKARLGLVITNDQSPRIFEDKLLGLPFTWL